MNNDLNNFVKDLELDDDSKKSETFNRSKDSILKLDYFSKQEASTPQTTPSNKNNNNNGFSLKQINFNEYLDVNKFLFI